MLLNYWLVIKAILLVAGLWWCKEIFGRLRSDIEDLRASDDAVRKGVIVFFWVLTVVIVALIGMFLWGLVSGIIKALR